MAGRRPLPAEALLPLAEEVWAEWLSGFDSRSASGVPGRVLRRYAEGHGLPKPKPSDREAFSQASEMLERVVDLRGRVWRLARVERRSSRGHYASRVHFELEQP